MINDNKKELTSELVNSIKKFAKKTGYAATAGVVASVSSFTAADATDGNTAVVEVVNGESTSAITATDVNGLLVDANGTTINANIITNANITFGATNSHDSITSKSTGTAITTFTIADSDTASAHTVTFAGDIDVSDSEIDDILTLINTNTNVLIQNDVIAANAANIIKFQMGSAAAAALTVDHDVAEAQDINMTIDGNGTNATTLNVTESTSTTSITTFAKAIGGTIAVTNININPTNNETVSVVFDATVKASTITIGDATDAASDNTSVTFEAQAADYTVTGTIDQAIAADEVAVHIVDTTANGAADTITFASAIGSSVAIDAITVGSATEGGDAIFNSSVSATTISLLGGNHASEDSKVNFKGDVTGSIVMNEATGQPTMTLGGAAAQTITGAITTADNEKGDVLITNTAGVTFTGAIGIDASRVLEVDIADGADTTFQGVISALTLDINTNAAGEIMQLDVAGHLIGDDSTNGGALQIAGGEMQLGTAIGASDVVFNIGEVTSGATGVVVATAGVTVTPAANFVSGTIALIDGDANTMTTTEQGDFFVNDNILTDFAVATTAQDINITATRRTNESIATTLGVTVNESKALGEIAQLTGDTALLAAFNDVLQKSSSETDDTAGTKAILDHMAPQRDGVEGSASAIKAMTGSVQTVVSNRMASLRSGDAYMTGMSAGNGMSANSAFIQAFGSTVEQDNNKVAGATIYGYDASTEGVAIGFDGMTDGGSTVGISGTFSTTDVTGNGLGKSTNSIDSYSVSVYADKSTDNGYLEGSLTYGLSDNSGKRSVNTATLTRNYTSNYDSTQISLKVAAGSPQEVLTDTYVTPFGSITGTLLSSDKYTETSDTANDALKLKVTQDDVSSVVGTVGIKAHKVTDKGTPMISLAVNNEFGDSTIDSTNQYTGGGAIFTTSSEIEEMSATLGLGYSFGNDMSSLSLGYEAQVNDDDYLSHFGSVKIVAKF
jgi:uncharacterized protein with beta-barrel porin domain